LREAGRDIPRPQRTLELNPAHPIVRSLLALALRGEPDERIEEWIEVLHDQALVATGAPLADPAAFARRITSLLGAVSQQADVARP
jgi:molecular chaperone HtpG